MSDRWFEGAARLNRQRTEAAAAEAERLAAAEAERLAAEAMRTQTHTEMQAAIAEATRALQAFMNEKGASAMALLAASRGAIPFGNSGMDGGQSTGVYLDSTGLQYELNQSNGQPYGSTPTASSTDCAKAVEYFAYHGQGRNNPDAVRDIVTWLTAQVEAHMPR